MKQRLASSLLVSVVLAAALYLGLRESPVGTEIDVAHSSQLMPTAPDDVGVEVDESPSGGWEAPVFVGRTLRAHVDGAAVRSHFEIGIAGTFPSLQAEGLQIRVPQLGEGTQTFEVRAVSADGSHAFWDTVPAATGHVDLVGSRAASVQVTGDAGNALVGARVRLARAAVGLIVLTVQTDATGAVRFEGLPAGRYHVTVEAPGHLTATRELVIGETDATLDVALDAGARVTGTVTSPDGPVADARVLVHVARAGRTDAADVVPEAVFETDVHGRWSADSLPPGATFVTAFAAGYAPTRSVSVQTSFTLEPATLDVELAPGTTVAAGVVDAQGRPVPGAQISWRDERTGFGETARTDDAGRATFVGLPPTALLEASFGGWMAPTIALDAVDDPGNVLLTLARFDASKLWRVRVAPSASVELWGLSATDAHGARCVVEPIGAHDFALRGCGPGSLRLLAETSAGPVETVTEAADGVQVTLAPPTPVELTLTGVADEDWGSTIVSLERDGAAIHGATRANGPELTVRAAAYPGRWDLVVDNARVGTRRFPVVVANEPVVARFELQADARLRLWVVDRHDAPVNGAWVMLYQGGRLVDVGRSGGQLPVEFAVRPPWSGSSLAVDPRRGEGSVSLQADAQGNFEHRITLSAPVMTAKIPPRRPSVEALAARLGARLVADDAGFVLDFETTDAPGLAAGLVRGDRLVTAWPDGGVMRVVVRRGGDYVDVAVP